MKDRFGNTVDVFESLEPVDTNQINCPKCQGISKRKFTSEV